MHFCRPNSPTAVAGGCCDVDCVEELEVSVGAVGVVGRELVHGEVDEQYAKQHHPLWYDEVMKGESRELTGGGAATPAPASPRKD